MINYIGKITQSEFEKLEGDPVGYQPMNNESEGYELESIYRQNIAFVIALRSHFCESYGKLINVKFSATYTIAYWINFSKLPR